MVGQCDAIHAAFLPAAFLARLKRLPVRVVRFLSIGFTFKAQAIFLAPYLLYLLMKKALPWKYLMLLPPVACRDDDASLAESLARHASRLTVGLDADLLAHVTHRAGGTMRQLAGADMLAKWHQQFIEFNPVLLR